MSTILPATAFAAGIATHLLYFKQYELHMHPWRTAAPFLLTGITVACAQVQFYDAPFRAAVASTSLFGTIFLAGIFGSLIVYRLFFNPLNRIPGPFLARLSRFYMVATNVKLDGHLQLLRLHEKYGRFVRVGPNDLSVTHPDGALVISAANSKFKKSAWYDGDSPRLSMHTTRDRALHDRRRRVWAPGFSDKALRGYEERIKVYNDLLINSLQKLSGEAVNASKWFNLYSFDVMGDLGFGESFGMLESGEEHWAIGLLNAGLEPMGLSFPIWFFRLLLSIPGAAKGYFRFIDYCNNQIDKRIKKGRDANQDIAGYLVEAFEKSQNKHDALMHLQGDSRLIIVAGSDTTAATLTHLFYYLAKYPECFKKLREEVAPLMKPDGDVQHVKIQDAQYLIGCINEALRLNPPVPCGVSRISPKEGSYIGGTFIAGNTSLQMPGYVIGRDEAIYPQALEFIPERWYSKPELVQHKDAFQPFSSGPYGCIGKNLALMELRTLTSRLVTAFDVAFAPEEDGTRLCRDTKEHFTLGLAPLELVFTKRK